MDTVRFLLSACLLSCSGLAHSNLIINGGFEQPGIERGWTFGQDPSGGWDGDNIEVWASGFLGVQSFEGSQHGELNAHGRHSGAWSIHQSFETILGGMYEVSFAYRARRHDNEAFRFELFGEKSGLINEIMDDHIKGEWNFFSDTFRGAGDMTTLKFTAITPSTRTVGNFIDGVSVTQLPTLARLAQIPAPSALLLMGAGLIGFSLTRRSPSKA